MGPRPLLDLPGGKIRFTTPTVRVGFACPVLLMMIAATPNTPPAASSARAVARRFARPPSIWQAESPSSVSASPEKPPDVLAKNGDPQL